MVQTLALLAAVLFGVMGLLQARIETGVGSLMPSSDASVQRFERLSQSFGGDPIVVLLEARQSRLLLQQRHLANVLGLEGRLSGLPGVAATYGPATTLNQTAKQAQLLLAELSGRRDGLRSAAEQRALRRGASPRRARALGEAAVADFDRRYGGLIVRALPVGLPTLYNQRFVENVIYNAEGEPRPEWGYVVPNERSLAILIRPREGLAQAATERLVHSVRRLADEAPLGSTAVTVAGVPRIVAALGDEAEHSMPVLGGLAVLAIGACLLVVPWTVRRRRLQPLCLTVVATTFTVAVLGWSGKPLSLGVLGVLPVLVGLGTFYPMYFARGARPRVVLTVAGATAAGFATLLLSPLPFVRDLGLTMSVGVLLSASLGWLFRPRTSSPAAQGRDDGSPGPQRRPRQWRHAIAGCAVAVCAVAGWACLPALQLQTNVQALTGGLAAVEQGQHVERVLGSSGEVDVVLRGGNVLDPEAWHWMHVANTHIITRHGDDMDPVLSPPELLEFLGDHPTGPQIRAGIRLMPRYLTGSVMREDARMALLSYGVALDDLKRLRGLEQALLDDLPAPPPGYRVEVTGLPMVAVRAYELVSEDRYLASLAGIGAAGTVLFAALRRRADAARAVVAAVIATGTEFLMLWMTDTAINPITVALGSLTAAVGCEFTVLTSESLRRGDRGLRLAVIVAALTSGAGFAALAASRLAVIREFGLLLTFSVLLSFLAAHFVVWVWPPRPSAGAEESSAQTWTPQPERETVLVGRG